MSTKPKFDSAAEWALSQKNGEESLPELHARLTTLVEQDNPTEVRLLPEAVSFDKIRAVVPDDEAFKVLSTPIWQMATGLSGAPLSCHGFHSQSTPTGKI